MKSDKEGENEQWSVVNVLVQAVSPYTEDYIEKSNIKVDDSTISETLIRKITFYIS